MKTRFKNIKFDNQKNGNPIILAIKKQVFLFFLLLSTLIMNAQVSNTSNSNTDILDVKAFIETLRGMDLNTTYTRAKNLENLLYNIQPSVYLYSGVVNSYGEKPKSFFTSITSLSELDNLDIQKNNIQIVTIRIRNSTELNSTIDFSVFERFINLKYIYIISSVDTTAQHLNSMILNRNEGYQAFYSIDLRDY